MSSTGTQLKAAALVALKIFLTGLAVLLVVFFAPWELPAKVLAVTLVLVVWPIWILIKHFRAKRPRAAAAPADSAAAEGAQGKLPQPGTYEELTRGVEEVVQWLRGSRLGEGKADEAAYALPWYVVAGPSGSGKTSLLLASGLDFQVLPSQRASEQRTIRPTAHCDWRVTDSAVWLDTSGRYQTEGPERDEWASLVETVKRHRRARPLDGFVLTINAAEVLRADEAEIERQAKVLRARLDEAARRAGARFPVYLVFSHMDAVEGFSEFFAPFDGEEQAQVWGSTLPLAQSDGVQARIDAEFDHLYGRLLRRRVVQLGAAKTPERQLRVFKFPGRFRRARAPLSRFAAALFRPNPFSERPLLRGLYFTSSPGAGPAGARHLNGGAYFAPQLFRDVVLADRNVVAAAQAGRRSPRLRRNLLAAVAAALVAAFVGGMVVSYFANKRMIAEADERAARLIEIRRAASRGEEQARGARFEDELAAAEDVRVLLAELDEHERTRPPLHMRFGLYAGAALNSSAPDNRSILRHLYFETVEEHFLKPAVAEIEGDLRAFAAGGGTAAGAVAAETAAGGSADEDYLGRHYDLLKAYLMLSKPDKVEPTFLAQVLRDYWIKAAPAGMSDLAVQQLDYFAGQAGKEDAPRARADNALVAASQDKLTAYPVVNIVYKRVTSEVSAAVKYPFKLSSVAALREGNLISNGYPVPGAFTLDGYREMTARLKSSVTDEFRKDDWVMRVNVSAGENLEAKKDELANMYYREYASHWQRFLQETRLRDFENKEDAVRSLRLLAGSTSPLEALLREVARQTNLSEATGGGLFGRLRGLFSKADAAGKHRQVEQEFAPLIKFVAGKPESSPMAEYRAQLKKLADALNADSKALPELSKATQAGADTIGMRSARQAVNDAAESRNFGATPAGVASARVLALPLDGLNSLLVGTDFAQIEKSWQALSAKARQRFESGFPFTDAGADISLAELAQFLNPQDGELTRFFKERLKPYFEEDWAVKREAADKFSPAFVAYVAAARRLRDALFPDGGKQPSAEYQLALAPVAGGAAVRVEIDGNEPLSTPDKTTATLIWPKAKSGVRLSVATTSGQDLSKSYGGEWGLLRLFREAGGGAGQGPGPFTLQPAGTGVRLTLQPKSGNPFARELFAALKAPKGVRPE